MTLPTINDIATELTSPCSITSGETLPIEYAHEIWTRLCMAQIDGFDLGYKIAMRTVIAKMKEMAAFNGQYDSHIFTNLAKEFEDMK